MKQNLKLILVSALASVATVITLSALGLIPCAT